MQAKLVLRIQCTGYGSTLAAQSQKKAVFGEDSHFD